MPLRHTTLGQVSLKWAIRGSMALHKMAHLSMARISMARLSMAQLSTALLEMRRPVTTVVIKTLFNTILLLNLPLRRITTTSM